MVDLTQSNLIGTKRTTFNVNNLKIDAGALTAVRNLTMPDVNVNLAQVATRYILFRVIDKTIDWSIDGSTAVGGDLVLPVAGTLIDIQADVDTAGTTGTAVVDVNLNGSTIMTTNKLKWDSTEKSTRTFSGTAATLTTTTFVIGDIITLDIDTNHTTVKSKGLTLYLAIKLT